MIPERRFRTFNDHLRSRFQDRVQRVTVTGGLVCPHPDGAEACEFCSAVRGDPDRKRGYPVHEQIRRGVNFSRRRGHEAPRLMVSVPVPPGACPPPDHLKATLGTIAEQGSVSVVSVSIPPEFVTQPVADVVAGFSTPDREIWLELEGAPAEWPIGRYPSLKLGVQIDLAGLKANGSTVNGNGENGDDSIRDAAKLVHHLEPDAVGLRVPTIRIDSPEARAYELGEIEGAELDDFAERAAQFLELIPATVIIHPVVLTLPSDKVAGPHWVLNRQKVQEAVSLALEERGTSQGESSTAVLPRE